MLHATAVISLMICSCIALECTGNGTETQDAGFYLQDAAKTISW